MEVKETMDINLLIKKEITMIEATETEPLETEHVITVNKPATFLKIVPLKENQDKTIPTTVTDPKKDTTTPTLIRDHETVSNAVKLDTFQRTVLKKFSALNANKLDTNLTTVSKNLTN